jgi:hypothetical protein
VSRWVLITAALVVAAVAGGIAFAAIPGSDGTISGCYRVSDGALRVIDAEAGQTCRQGEKPLSWSGAPRTELRQVFSNMTVTPGVSGMDIVCPSGFAAVGGGWNFNAPGVHIQVWKNIQSSSSSRVWEFGFRNDDSQSWFTTGFALCARPL